MIKMLEMIGLGFLAIMILGLLDHFNQLEFQWEQVIHIFGMCRGNTNHNHIQKKKKKTNRTRVKIIL